MIEFHEWEKEEENFQDWTSTEPCLDSSRVVVSEGRKGKMNRKYLCDKKVSEIKFQSIKMLDFSITLNGLFKALKSIKSWLFFS